MPRYTDITKHCINCRKRLSSEGCSILKKVESEEFYTALDTTFKTFFGVEVWFSIFQTSIGVCSEFDPTTSYDPIESLMTRALAGEKLSEEDQILFEKIMQGEGGG
jgi:hypothetical protein